MVIGGKRTQPFSSTPAITAPSGEEMSTSVGRVDRPPAAGSTISPTGCLSGQRRWMVGRSPAIHAVVRSPSVRLRADSPAPRAAVESAVAVMRPAWSGAISYSSRSSSSPVTGTALAFTSYVPAVAVEKRRCRPASVPVGENPAGSAVRCRETTSAEASLSPASVGSRSRRVTWTSGRSISEKPAPASPVRRATESVIVSFIQLDVPFGALTRCVEPSGRRKLVAAPLSVSTRTRVGADRTLSCGNGVTLKDDGRSREPVKSIRSHWPFGEPATPSVHAVAGLPSKAFTGSNCGRWKSQLP